MKGVVARLVLASSIFVFFLPALAGAQVVINEVMYNPAGSDSGREWIELYNQGSADAVMVGGTVKGSWRLSDGSNHTLTDPAGGTGRGSLTIPAGGYLIIASDPGDFISGEYAGGTYSVVKSSISLNNTGATVSLLDGTGSTVDSVSYTNSQGGNDDGSSLQRQADGSWLAALPTPGAANSAVAYVPLADTGTSTSSDGTTDTSNADTSSQDQTQSASAPTDSYVAPPTPNLFADAGADRTVIVGADVEFTAEAYDKDQNVLDPSTVRFSWNYGDGATAEGQTVLHHFSYPGRYAVVLDIAQNTYSASDEAIIIAEPAALSFKTLSDGGVEIDDLASHGLDLSDWVVRADAGVFAAQLVLPEHSEILAGSSMHISAQTLQFRASSSTMLEYPNGVLALAAGQTTQNAAGAGAPAAPVLLTQSAPPAGNPSAPQPASEAQSASAPDVQQMSDELPAPDAPSATSSTSSEVAAAASAAGGSKLWWLAAFAFAALAAGALVAAKYFGKKEWDVVEEKGE